MGVAAQLPEGWCCLRASALSASCMSYAWAVVHLSRWCHPHRWASYDAEQAWQWPLWMVLPQPLMPASACPASLHCSVAGADCPMILATAQPPCSKLLLHWMSGVTMLQDGRARATFPFSKALPCRRTHVWTQRPVDSGCAACSSHLSAPLLRDSRGVYAGDVGHTAPHLHPLVAQADRRHPAVTAVCCRRLRRVCSLA